MSAATSDLELLDALRAWRDRAPKPDIRGLPKVSVPTLGRLRKLLPEGSAHRLLALSYSAALRSTQPTRLLAAARVDGLEALGRQPLDAAQARARRAARHDLAWAAGTGTALGLAGVAGLATDAPTLVVLALRSLIRVGYCFGETPGPALAAAIFALASADTVDEKRIAWQAAMAAEAGVAESAALDDAALRDGLERAAEREFAKQALAESLQKLGLSMTRKLGWRKAAGALPLLGAALGGAVNARFVAQVVEAAIQVCTARRLQRDGHDVLHRPAAVTTATTARPKRKAVRRKTPRERPENA